MGKRRGATANQGGIGDGALFAGLMSSGGASGVVCLPDDDGVMCTLRRAAATVQALFFLAMMAVLAVWAWHRRRRVWAWATR